MWFRIYYLNEGSYSLECYSSRTQARCEAIAQDLGTFRIVPATMANNPLD